MCIAVPGRITSIGDPSTAMIPGEVVFPDRELDVNLVMVPEARVGDHIVVHSGYAIRIVSRETAATATTLLCPDAVTSTTEPSPE